MRYLLRCPRAHGTSAYMAYTHVEVGDRPSSTAIIAKVQDEKETQHCKRPADIWKVLMVKMCFWLLVGCFCSTMGHARRHGADFFFRST